MSGPPQDHAVKTDSTGVFQIPSKVDVYLRFMYLDPTGHERFFPVPYERKVRIVYLDGSTEEYAGDSVTGVVNFETKRAKGSFTCEFVFDEPEYIVNEPLGRESKLNSLWDRAAAEEYASPPKAQAADIAQAKAKAEQDSLDEAREKARKQAEDQARGESKGDKEIKEAGDRAAESFVPTEEDQRRAKAAGEAQGKEGEQFYEDNGPPPWYRVFELPKKITLKNSDWECKSPHYDAGKFSIDLKKGKPRKIGSETTPVTLTLDPHWQYIKFEYFDRWFGHSDHDNKPISVVPLLLEGYEDEPGKLDADAAARKDKWKTRSNWHIGKDDKLNNAIQCLPWIIQRSDDGATEQPKPDKKTTLAFLTPEKERFIKAEEAEKRFVVELKDDADDAKPCPNRLKYYDLPEVWKSRKYWCRTSDKKEDQNFYEEMIKKIAKDTTDKKKADKDKPLIFSLDDIVLLTADDAGTTLTVADIPETERPAVFYHEFLDPANDPLAVGTGGRDGKTYSKWGQYQLGPDKAGSKTRAEDEAKDKTLNDATVQDEKRKEATAEVKAELKNEMKQRLKTKMRMDDARADTLAAEAAQNRTTGKIAKAIQQRIDTKYNAKMQTAANQAKTAAGPKSDTDYDAANAYPYSDVKMLNDTHHNYIADYPHWTRLVIVNGNAFDVFDKRTPEKDGEPVGARAGVRWMDALPCGGSRPDRKDRKYFSIQPHREQKYCERYKPFNPAESRGIGRVDQILLRCCGKDNSGDEVGVILSYFRYNFTFTAPPDNGLTEEQYASQAVMNVPDRWNGPDGGMNPGPPELIPDDGGKTKLKVRVRWYMQVQRQANAHMRVSVEALSRASMSSHANADHGTGKLGPAYYTTNPTASSPGRFSTAHESGHVSGLPDEYGESSNDASYWHRGFRWNLPGDPFDKDMTAMMRTNQELRNKHYWHVAEWMWDVLKVNFKLKHGAYDSFQLPHHRDAPAKSYVWWPVKHANSQTLATHGKFDLFLYRLGIDHTAKTVYPTYAGSPGTDIDGVLVVVINLKVKLRMWANWDKNELSRHGAALVAAADSKLNKKWYARGTLDIDVKDKDGNATTEQIRFDRCMLLFSPRILGVTYADGVPFYCSTPPPTKGKYTGYMNAIGGWCGVHQDLEVDRAKAGRPFGTSWPGANSCKMVINRTNNHATNANHLKTCFEPVITEMAGFDTAKSETANAQLVAKKVLPGAIISTF